MCLAGRRREIIVGDGSETVFAAYRRFARYLVEHRFAADKPVADKLSALQRLVAVHKLVEPVVGRVAGRVFAPSPARPRMQF